MDLPAAKQEPSYGFYAGLDLAKLSVGPLPAFEAALEAARHEHGAAKTIYVVEACAPEPVIAPFGSGEIDRVLEWIENDNAFPFGSDAVLPRLRTDHLDDLARRLNAAVGEWLGANGLKMISPRLGPAKSAHAVIPHEVDSVTVSAVTPPPAPKIAIVVADEFDPIDPGFFEAVKSVPGVGVAGPEVFMPVAVVEDFAAWLADALALSGLCCSDCRSPKRCAEEGCNAKAPAASPHGRCEGCHDPHWCEEQGCAGGRK